MQSKGVRGAVLGAVAAAAMLLAGAAQAALQDRDLDKDGKTDAFYDTDLKITWLRNADVNGQMNWADAVAWAAAYSFAGYSDWRLPTLGPVDGKAFQWVTPSNNGSTDRGWAKTGTGWGVASEMGHLFYVSLGNKGYCTPNDASPGSCVVQPGYGLTNKGSFQNLRADNYWTGLVQVAITPAAAWLFNPADGSQGWYYESWRFYAMAVTNGDVGAVPEPETYALMLAGLAALALARRNQRR